MLLRIFDLPRQMAIASIDKHICLFNLSCEILETLKAHQVKEKIPNKRLDDNGDG